MNEAEDAAAGNGVGWESLLGVCEEIANAVRHSGAVAVRKEVRTVKGRPVVSELVAHVTKIEM